MQRTADAVLGDSADEAAWRRRLDRAREAIRSWEGRFFADPEDVPQGSPLAFDDAAAPHWPTSLVAWSSITTAVDHLGLAYDAIEGQRSLRPSAFYVPCRSGLLVGSQAVWVMIGSAVDRRHRTLWCQAEEEHGWHEYLKDYQNDEEFADDVSPEMLEQISALVVDARQRRDSIRREIPREVLKRFTATRMLKDVASHVSSQGSHDQWLRRALAFEWRVSSGAAHGRVWPTRVRPSQTIPVLGTSTHIRRTTSTVETYATSLGAATLVVSEAVRLWDERRTVPSGKA